MIAQIPQLQAHHVQQLVELYQHEWWTKGRTLNDVKTMLANTDFVFAYTDEKDNLVAFARVLTDRVYKAFLFDVIVAQHLRGSRVGASIIEDVIKHPELASVQSIELYCLPELNGFYEAFGFSTNIGGINLMRRPRNPA